MGRGISPDRLPDDVAKRIRAAIREARQLKGVTNSQISVWLNWGKSPARVVRMLAAGRPLRNRNAQALLVALFAMRPRNAEATTLLRKASGLVGSVDLPAVLIPTWEFDHLAEHLANELYCKPGVRAVRRSAFERDIRYAISRAATGMAAAFYSACWTRFEAVPLGGELLKVFGYVVNEEGRFEIRSRASLKKGRKVK